MGMRPAHLPSARCTPSADDIRVAQIKARELR